MRGEKQSIAALISSIVLAVVSGIMPYVCPCM
jgi:hypothetical protein